MKKLILLTVIVLLSSCGGGGGGTTQAASDTSDTVAPVIALVGNSPLTIAQGSTYIDAGSTVTDNVDAGLTATVTGTVNTATAGTYTLTYNVSDVAGNAATPVTRTVNVTDQTAPVIALIGANPITVAQGSTYIDAGSTVTDNVETGLTATATGTVNTAIAGTYTLTYNVSDAAGNAAIAVARTVVVTATPPIIPPTFVSMNITPGQFQFSWTAAQNADHYRILVNPDGASGFTPDPLGANIPISATSFNLPYVAIKTNWLAAQYIVEACDATETTCVGSSNQTLTLSDSLVVTMYAKASNTGVSDWFGSSVSLSGDGNTLAVGAHREASAATGIGGNQADNTSNGAGAVYVFSRTGAVWTQQAYVKASNTGVSDYFGVSVALSADGNTLAVGAYGESSAATGVGGNQLDNTAPAAGVVYVFSRTGSTWVQQAYVKASNTGARDGFGYSVALSTDGNTLAVGAFNERSAATGVGGNQLDNTAPAAGAVYVFSRTGTVWAQQAYVKASNTGAGDYFGVSVALSADGNTLAVGAYGESSAATGVGGNQLDNTAPAAGVVYVFSRTGSTWVQQAYVKASNAEIFDYFGVSVALSADGNTLAVGAKNEASVATGIGGNQLDNAALSAGAVYVFGRTGSAWAQQVYVKASNTGANDYFGYSVALSADGNTLAVGAHREVSAATGVSGNQLDNTVGGAGAVYVFSRTGSTWVQQAYVKASNTGAGDFFGYSVALSADGNTLAVGAYQESSAATGIGGNQLDNTASSAGAVYLY